MSLQGKEAYKVLLEVLSTLPKTKKNLYRKIKHAYDKNHKKSILDRIFSKK